MVVHSMIQQQETQINLSSLFLNVFMLRLLIKSGLSKDNGHHEFNMFGRKQPERKEAWSREFLALTYERS